MRRTFICASLLLLAAPLLKAAENTASPSGTGSQKQASRPTDSTTSAQKKTPDKNSPEASKSAAEPPKEASKESSSSKDLSKDASKEPSKDTSKAKRTFKDSKEKSAQGDRPPATEDERFSAARNAASEDKVVSDLRTKADTAKTQEAGTRAMRAYMRGLYSKMRSIEPSLQERINLTEAAALRALPQPSQPSQAQ